MITETGTETHSIVDGTPGQNGLEAWRRMVQRFGPASAHANLNLLSSILKPPRGTVDNISYLIEKWERMVRRQKGRTDRQVLSAAIRSGQS